jgi:hypothetical protein
MGTANLDKGGPHGVQPDGAAGERSQGTNLLDHWPTDRRAVAAVCGPLTMGHFRLKTGSLMATADRRPRRSGDRMTLIQFR